MKDQHHGRVNIMNNDLKEFEEYVKWIKENETAEEAKAALIRMGVLNPDGSQKENIVTECHLI